eukprot:PhF_6_TR29196/c0_g1_i1/m.42718
MDDLKTQFHDYCQEVQGNISAFLAQLTTEFEHRTEDFLADQVSLFKRRIDTLHGDTIRAIQAERETLRYERMTWDRERDELEARLGYSQSHEKVLLDVGGHHYATTLSTLRKEPKSILGVMFGGKHPVPRDAEGRYFIDRNGEYFGYILDYLRDGVVHVPDALREGVLREAEFYRVNVVLSGPSGGIVPNQITAPPVTTSTSNQQRHMNIVTPTVSSSKASSMSPQPVVVAPPPPSTPPITHCVFSRKHASQDIHFCSGDRTILCNSSKLTAICMTTGAFDRGVHRIAFQVNHINGDVGFGICTRETPLEHMLGTTRGPNGGCCFHSSGNIIYDGEHASYGQAVSANDVITVLLDFTQGTLSFRCNQKDMGVAFDRSDVPLLGGSDNGASGGGACVGAPLYFAVALYGKETSV